MSTNPFRGKTGCLEKFYETDEKRSTTPEGKPCMKLAAEPAKYVCQMSFNRLKIVNKKVCDLLIYLSSMFID